MICRRAAPRCAATSRVADVAGAAGAARLSAFPLASGFRQPQLTSPRAACRQELGSFRFTSKTHRCVAHVFVMRVTEVRAHAPLRASARAHAISLQELAVWPERHERQREWVRAPARPWRDPV